jgi:acetyl esterase/lipase
MAAILTYQPVKALYALLAAAFEAARLPFWILLYTPSAGRPNKAWTLRQAIGVKVLKQFVCHMSVVEVSTPHNLKPGSEKERFVTYDPAPADVYKGPLVDNEIKPIKIGGTWTPKPVTSAEIANGNVDVVLHFHGGAYVIGDGRDQDTGFLAKTILKNARVTHVFTPNYRLASNPGGRFPAAFQDAVSSYYYLVKTLKVPADRITVSGDSAGGNLTFALLRYIAEYGKQVGLPTPGCAWFWSPWVDVDAARDPKNINKSPQYKTDMLTSKFGQWGARNYAPTGKGFDTASPYVSPLGNPFKSETPLWIHTSNAEVLYQDDVEIAGQFKGLGNKVDLVISENVPHDVLLLGHILGFQKEAAEVAKKAGEFLRTERAKL